MMNHVAVFLFWMSATFLFYIYIGYPLLIFFLATYCGQPRIKRPNDLSVSVVIAVHNEANRLVPKIQSLLNADDRDQIQEILIASDGSTDHTETILAELDAPKVRLLSSSQRRGKSAMVNWGASEAVGDVILFTDARQELSEHAVTELVSGFSDSFVGVVSGELVFREKSNRFMAGRGMGAYWRYEKFIRRHEARYHSIPGATGALYAIRRNLFCAIPENVVLDDVVIPMQAILRGQRCCFESNAVAYDVTSKTAQQESVRKRRTLAGCVQLIRLFPGWLLPWRNPIWVQYVSHKLLRLASPFLLLVVLGTTVMVGNQSPYDWLLGLQVVVYGVACVSLACERLIGKALGFGVLSMFISLNLDSLFAVCGSLLGRYSVGWERASSGSD